MLSLLWNISAAIRGYLRFYMPTNRALDWLRSPRGLKWAIPGSVVAAPTYLFGMGMASVVAQRPGLGWLNVLVVLFFWNALKFAWLAVLAPIWALRVLRTGQAAAPDLPTRRMTSRPYSSGYGG